MKCGFLIKNMIPVLMTCPFLAFGQFKNIKLDEADSIGFPPSEPSVAINLKDKDNIVVGAIIDKVYVTKDGGNSWSKQRLTSSYGVWGDPVVVSDKKGAFYYLHLSDPTGENWKSDKVLDRIVCQKSKDGGEVWDDGSYMGLNHPKDQDKHWATIDLKNNNILVSWTQFDKYGSTDPADKSNILFSRSSGGKKWSKPVQLNKISGDCLDGDNTTEGAMPAVGPFGQLFVTWSHAEKIYLDRSFDDGKTWLNNDMEIAEQPGGWSFEIPGINRCNGMPVLLADHSPTRNRGRLYLCWSDQRNGEDDTDIWFATSQNSGDYWYGPVRVNDDGPGKHQFFSWMALDQTSGYLYIIYYDRRDHDDLNTDVYLAYSINGGNSFVNKKISDTPFVPTKEVFFGDYTNISAHDGRICAVWTRMDEGKTSIWATVIEHEDLIKD